MSVSLNDPAPHLRFDAETRRLPMGLTTAALRDFIAVQLRSTDRAVSTSELRHRASEHDFSDLLVEGTYRLLVTLERRGQAQRVASRGRSVYWVNNASMNSHPAAAIERFIS
ncbi:hypothetical protein [Mycolicibacterium sp.]|uniref:hypothetical protein n=1 Tax=Mycolicibacterium sp. TaxID=2320850 RepID=UPI003D0F8C3E